MAGRASSIDVFLKLRGQRQFRREADQAGADLERMGVRGAKGISAFVNTGEKLKNFGRSWTRNVTIPVVAGMALAGKAAVDWESAFAGVRKTVDATEKQYASLEKGIRGMSLQIPVAANELAGIAEAAGQLGIKRQAILGFTRTIADLGVATNLTGEEGATTLARFANITQMPQSKFDRLGSTIVALGNAGASTEKDIASMGLRLAGAGNQVGMHEAQILGFANALSSVGIEAEAGGTAMSKVFKTINSAVLGGGGQLERFAKVAGMGGEQFARVWGHDAASATTSFIEGLGRMGREGKDLSGFLGNLDTAFRGERVQDTLARASGAGKLLRESLDLGAKSWKENNALTEEAEKRYKTVASQLQILKNKVVDAGVTLGQDLLPPMIQLVEFVGPRIGAVAEGFAALPGPVKATALGLLVLTGPVASGLGYFATGMGKALIITRKLAAAGQSMQAFSWARQRGMGMSAASGYAFGGTGAAAAMQTAKGFALSLGPALAAVGVANVASEAMEGDWKAAGFKAGGAIAGGIAGFMVGGPLGAMIGVGLGSMGGGLLSRLLGSSSEVARLHAQTQRVTEALKAQGEASKFLVGARKRLTGADRVQERSAHSVVTMRRRLNRTVEQFGAASLEAHQASIRLERADRREAQAAREVQLAHRLKGNALRLYNRQTTLAVAAEKQRLPTLNRVIKSLNARLAKEPHNLNLLERVVGKERERSKSLRTIDKLVRDAGGKSGPKLANTLSKMNAQQAEYGRRGKVLTDRLVTQRIKLKELTDQGLKQTPMWQDVRREIDNTLDAFERFTDAVNGGRPSRRGGGSSEGGGSRNTPKSGGTRRRPSVPGGKRRSPQAGTSSLDFKSAFGRRDLTVKVPVQLDGKTIAESTAQVAEDDAAYAP